MWWYDEVHYVMIWGFDLLLSHALVDENALGIIKLTFIVKC
jgi:hypothetical protein